MIEHRIKEHEMTENSKMIDKIRSKTRKGVYHATGTIMRESRQNTRQVISASVVEG